MTDAEIKFFDSAASAWDAHERLSLPPKISRVLDIVTIPRGGRILDLGTGTGVLLPQLAERIGPQGSITAVDISSGMLSRARRKAEHLEAPVNFLLTDFEKNHLPGIYDRIMLYSVYPHLQYPVRTLLRLREENLAEGGIIAIAFPCSESFINSIHKHKKVEHEQLPPALTLASTLRAAGLRACAVATSPVLYIILIYND